MSRYNLLVINFSYVLYIESYVIDTIINKCSALILASVDIWIVINEIPWMNKCKKKNCFVFCYQIFCVDDFGCSLRILFFLYSISPKKVCKPDKGH
jgi:hypothetical protein